MLFAEGLEKAAERHRLLAEAARRAVTAWSEGGALELNIRAPAERSNSVTTVLLTNGHEPKPLLDYCNHKCGVVVGIGIGALNDNGFRIAHMGHVNAPMVLGTLGVVETGLVALGIPHGKGGVQAAIDWLGKSVLP
jgi:alanine-glyoxylate transaminase/serine-glyoxylate transaminase/serine-pyruvate transaminase